MPSPFPGMNPYLEGPDSWPSFHTLMIARMVGAINSRIAKGYIAKAEDRLYVCDFETRLRSIGRTDIAVREHGELDSAAIASTITAPMMLEFAEDETERLNLPAIEIVTRSGKEIVTVIELLSPSNKYPGNDREQFSRKRKNLRRSTANYVEIDLLRGGHRHDLGIVAPSVPYYVMISRTDLRPRAAFWPIGLRDPLPLVEIPLRPAVSPVRVDLQECLHLAYDEGLFAEDAYDTPLIPPLDPADAAWAAQFVPGRPA